MVVATEMTSLICVLLAGFQFTASNLIVAGIVHGPEGLIYPSRRVSRRERLSRVWKKCLDRCDWLLTFSRYNNDITWNSEVATQKIIIFSYIEIYEIGKNNYFFIKKFVKKIWQKYIIIILLSLYLYSNKRQIKNFLFNQDIIIIIKFQVPSLTNFFNYFMHLLYYYTQHTINMQKIKSKITDPNIFLIKLSNFIYLRSKNME